jgi:hypothetical protein
MLATTVRSNAQCAQRKDRATTESSSKCEEVLPMCNGILLLVRRFGDDENVEASI